MPSGISHMLLSRHLPVDKDRPYLNKQRFNLRFFLVGGIAPDHPCAA